MAARIVNALILMRSLSAEENDVDRFQALFQEYGDSYHQLPSRETTLVNCQNVLVHYVEVILSFL